MLIVDLDAAAVPDSSTLASDSCIVCVSTRPDGFDARQDRLIDIASVTIVGGQTSDRRCVSVDSVDDTLEELERRVTACPVAAATADDVLRCVVEDTRSGVVLESLAYSTLQAGSEFAGWLASKGPVVRHQADRAVVVERSGSHLDIALNCPERHNAFSDVVRSGLLDALAVAIADPAIESVTLSGRGPSFCSGGDLREFGSFRDPADAHLARTRHSPALLIDRVADRLGGGAVARVHGAVLGSGLEMAAFFPRVVAHHDSRLGLPELGLGLLPGAGGTVSVRRRIGRWRTMFLLLTGAAIDAGTALDWGLVDEVVDSHSE
ncbi:enoyl-CoA hydratase/isomerase family protein [Gordonia terrae]